jgi:hypothetical protein
MDFESLESKAQRWTILGGQAIGSKQWRKLVR